MRRNKIKHKKIKPYKKVNEFGEGGFYDQDPAYTNKVFKVKYTSFRDLSNKRGSDSKPKPIDDPLDIYEVGDRIPGLDQENNKVGGNIIEIDKDANGNGIGVYIEFNGKKTPMRLATIKMESDRGGRVNQSGEPGGGIQSIEDIDTVVPYSEKLTHLKNYGQFVNESLSHRRQ